MAGFGLDADVDRTQYKEKGQECLRPSWCGGVSLARYLLKVARQSLACKDEDSLFCAMLALACFTAASGLSLALLTGSAFLAGTIFGAGLLIAAHWHNEVQAEQIAECDFGRADCHDLVRAGGEQCSGVLNNENLSRAAVRDRPRAEFDFAAGSWTVYLPDGVKVRNFADGRRTILRRFDDGTEMLKRENFPSGDSVDLRFSNGISIEVFSDGKKTVDNRAGFCVEESPGGTKSIYDLDYRLLAKIDLPVAAIAENRRLFDTLSQMCAQLPSIKMLSSITAGTGSELSDQNVPASHTYCEGDLERLFFLLESMSMQN